MVQLFAASYVYENGYCYVDGVLQATNDACTKAAGIGVAVMIPLILISLVFFVCWVISLIHVISHQDVPNRVLWIVLHFIGLSTLAGPIYLLFVKRAYDRNKKVAAINSTPVSPTPAV